MRANSGRMELPAVNSQMENPIRGKNGEGSRDALGAITLSPIATRQILMPTINAMPGRKFIQENWLIHFLQYDLSSHSSCENSI